MSKKESLEPTTTATISVHMIHRQWINSQPKEFNFSKWVREKIDEEMKVKTNEETINTI